MRQFTSPTSSVLRGAFLHSDHLGSASLTTDASGSVVARQLYDAWGNVRLRGDVKTDIGYTGQHEEVGIHAMFYRARYYSPSLGRFLSADTIVPDGKNPQQFNRYAYTLNNPVKYSDPTGHDVDCGIGDKNCRRQPKKTNPLPPIQQCTDTCPKDAATRVNAEEAFRLFLSNPGYYAYLWADPDLWYSNDDALYFRIYSEYYLHMDPDQVLGNGFSRSIWLRIC